MAEVILNGQAYEFNEGDSILDVAKKNDIDIPVMCYLKHVTPTGACRLCLVEVEGFDKPMAACVTYAMDGMKVNTDTKEVIAHRKQMMDFILMKHPLDCPTCDKAGECMLQDTAYDFGIMEETVSVPKPEKEIKVWNKIIHNENLCILCEKCVKICHEVTGRSALKIEERGFNNYITTVDEDGLNCDFCGLCVDYCPVGALLDTTFNHKMRVWDLEDKYSTCSYCPSGCKLKFGVADGKIQRANAREEGFICTLGRNGYKYIESEDRVTFPAISQKASSWEDAVKELSNIDKKSLAVVLGSRLGNESIHAYSALTNKVICDLETIDTGFYAKYEAKFGTRNNIGQYSDIVSSDFVFVIGADMGQEVIGTKWHVMMATAKNKGELVSIGLNTYEIDKYARLRMNADYGDFATKINEFLTSDDELIAAARLKLERANKVSIIIGNEYLSTESKNETVLALADYIGQEKLGAFFVLNDKANYIGMQNAGIPSNGYTPQQLIADIESGAVKTVVAADYYPYGTTEMEKNLEAALAKVNVVSVDFLTNKFNTKSQLLLPVTVAYEQCGTTTTIDNRIGLREAVVSPLQEAKTDVEIASLIGKSIGITIPDTEAAIWDTMIKGNNGYPDVEFRILEDFTYKIANTEFNKTDYSYEKNAQGNKEVFINAKYQNGFMSTKANLIEKSYDGSTKEFFFDADLRCITGTGVSAPKDSVMNENMAKGILLIPKNR